jgi:hypothetical protein
MTNPSLQPEVTDVEGVDQAAAGDDLARTPEEKLNHEQSAAPTKDEDGQ